MDMKGTSLDQTAFKCNHFNAENLIDIIMIGQLI